MDVVAYPISATIDNEKDQDLSPITTLCPPPPKPPDLCFKLVHLPLAPPPALKSPDQILPIYSHQLMTHNNSETSESSKHTNTRFSAVARQVFVKIPQTIMPTFYLNTTLLQNLETNFILFQSSFFMLDCFTMSGISSNCGTLDIVHCGIVELRIAWSLLFRDYTHGAILVTNALFQDHEFFIHAATTNKIFKYLKDFYNLEDKVGLHGVDSDISHVVWVQCLLACMFHNEGIIDYNKVVEVEMIEKIKHMILASKLGFVAALHQIEKCL
jgi:hypothetical protein